MDNEKRIKAFWERVKNLIQQTNYTQKTLSVELGYASRTIELYIYRNALPDFFVIEAIAKKLKTSVNYLLYGYEFTDDIVITGEEKKLVLNYRELTTDQQFMVQTLVDNCISHHQ